MKKLIGIAFLLMAVISNPDVALPNPLYTFVGNCAGADCFGSTYTLVVGDANDAVGTTYTASLIINTAGYTGPGQFIDAVDFKVVNSLISGSYSLTTAPGGASNWQSYFNNGQAATDCGSGGGFFVCARDPNPNNLAPIGGILTWDWIFSSNDKISFGHIGASYNNAAGTINGNNTSISSASLPTPGTMFLLGAGLIVLGSVVRKFGPRQG